MLSEFSTDVIQSGCSQWGSSSRNGVQFSSFNFTCYEQTLTKSSSGRDQWCIAKNGGGYKIKTVTLLLWTITEALLSVLVYLNCLKLALCIHMKTIFIRHHYSLELSKKWDVVMLFFFLDL